MSVFASQTKSDPIPVPFDPPHTIVVRSLTGRELDLAEAEDLRGFVSGRSPRGWAATFHKALANGTATDADAQQALADPLNGYDRHVVARFGVVSWSYRNEPTEKQAKDAAFDPHTPTPAQLTDLSDEMVEFIAVEAMKRTKPDRFQTLEEMEAAQKNALGPSISS